jgi:glycosyltransferase involved in cell wall biosynthesis
MRICQIISVPMPPREGIGYYAWNLARFLVMKGHVMHVVTRGERGKPQYEVVDGIAVWRPRFYPCYPFHVHLHGLFTQRLVRRLEGDVDLFHLHTPLPPPIRSIRPILLTIHSMVLASIRSQCTCYVQDVPQRLQAPVSALIERRLFDLSSKVTAVSKAAARDAESLLLASAGSIQVTWNGVDTCFFSPGAKEAPTSGLLLFVGRLSPAKGLADLVQAMTQVARQHPGAKLSIAGSGSFYRNLTSLIRQSGLEWRITLLGHVGSRERLRDLYREAWVLVLPSHRESMPTVVLEAMACGTPVISTRVGSVPDVITHGVNGLLVRTHAPEELAQAICGLLDDTRSRAQLAAAARSTVSERFSWEKVGTTYLSCYQMLLNRDYR